MLKKIFWFVVIGFVAWALIDWLITDADLVGLAREAGDFFSEGKEALGVFFDRLTAG